MTKKERRLIKALQQAEAYARKHGLNFMYITEVEDHWEFESTGSPEWSQDAADVLTEMAVNAIDEDENAQIDALVNDCFTEEKEN